MSLKDLLKDAEAAAPKMRSSEDQGPKVVWIDMSRKGYKPENGDYVPANQGIISYIPIAPEEGKPIKYLYDVKEFLIELEEGNLRWSKIPDVKDFNTEVPDDGKALITQVRSMISHLPDLGFDFTVVNTKSYALMFAYVIAHTSIDNDAVITDSSSRKLALLIFPSKNFAKSMTQCLKSMEKMGEMGDEMYEELFSRNTHRTCYLETSFSRSAGFGYDCSTVAKAFDRFSISMLTDEERKEMALDIPQELIDLCHTQTALFLSGNREDCNDYKEDYIKETYAQLKEVIEDTEKEAKQAEEIPAIPSKNRKKKENWDKEVVDE